jgi:hypothetical protein
MNRTDNSRRDFLKHAALFGGASILTPTLFAQSQGTKEDANEKICSEKFALAADQSLRNKPFGEVIVSLGQTFLGTTYVANALEVPGKERLVINLEGLDCVTFVETALTLARCVKLKKTTFADYQTQLQLVRYRDGIIDEYPSRLHYFSDWIDNNEKKKVVRNVTKTLGGLPFAKTINFMSTHSSTYQQLANTDFLKKIAAQELALNERRHFYIQKETLPKVQSGIKNGDIIGITTSMQGMDIAHTGLAIWVSGTLKFLHAPLSGSFVQMSEKSLHDYLMSHEKQTGIMVARPLEPTA